MQSQARSLAASHRCADPHRLGGGEPVDPAGLRAGAQGSYRGLYRGHDPWLRAPAAYRGAAAFRRAGFPVHPAGGVMKVFLFHLMPYAHLDMGYAGKYRVAWVVLPNTYFDPKKGHELYNRYLDELELAAELGFDGISVNEHHQNAYGLMPSPIVMAAALSRRVTQAKIAILGSAFCLRQHPLNIADGASMNDCITGGGVLSGLGGGHGGG